jgi:hypothetical protein
MFNYFFKNLNTLFLTCALAFISIANAQEVRVIDNKGTINTIRELIVGTDGLLYAYDGTRIKWLSVDRNLIGWGRNKINAGSDDPLGTQYLRQYNGAPSDLNGWRMIRDGTITAITVQSNADQTYKVEIEKNNNTTAILTLLVANTELGKHVTTINVDFDEGDFLQCYLDASAVQYPQVLIEIAWRQ